MPSVEVHSDEAMICFYPPYNVARKLRVRSGLPADDLHVTLMYLGRQSDYKLSAWEIQDRVMEFAEHSDSPRLWHQGYGMFDNGDEKVVWASVNGHDLYGLRASLVDFMAQNDVKSPSAFKNYIPHMSLRFCKHTPSRLPWRLFDGMWTQNTISLVIGDERTDFNMKERDGDYFWV